VEDMRYKVRQDARTNSKILFTGSWLGRDRVRQVVWSCLLLLEMIMNYLNVAANLPQLSIDVVQRVVDLLRVSAFGTMTSRLAGWADLR
jgi:hypothetical protein